MEISYFKALPKCFPKYDSWGFLICYSWYHSASNDTKKALILIFSGFNPSPTSLFQWGHTSLSTALVNCSLRDGVLPTVWKSANIIPLPKTKRLISVTTDIRPISLTPIAAKVFESIIIKHVDDTVCDAIDSKQFGGIAGTSTTDALVEMTHRWYEAADKLITYVHVDFSQAFDLINHHILLDTLTNSGLPVHIVRWIGAFLHDRCQKVIIGNTCSSSGSPNGGGCPRVPCPARNGFFIVH